MWLALVKEEGPVASDVERSTTLQTNAYLCWLSVLIVLSKVILELLAKDLKNFFFLTGSPSWQKSNSHSFYRPSIKNVQEQPELNDYSEPLNNTRAKAGQPSVLDIKLAGKSV